MAGVLEESGRDQLCEVLIKGEKMTSKKTPAQLAQAVYDRVQATNQPEAEHMIGMCHAMAFGTAYELNRHGYPAVVVEGYYLSCFVDGIDYKKPKRVRHYWAALNEKIFDLTMEQFNEENIFGRKDDDDRHIETRKIMPGTPEMKSFVESFFQRGYGGYVAAATSHDIQ